jgi:hypothetical protein
VVLFVVTHKTPCFSLSKYPRVFAWLTGDDLDQALTRESAMVSERDTLLSQVRQLETEVRNTKDAARECLSALESKQNIVDTLNGSSDRRFRR